MRNKFDFKSSFRILKGGKISLVVSALLVGSTMITTAAHAEGGLTPVVPVTTDTSRVTTDNGLNWSEILTYTNTAGSAVSVAAYNGTEGGLQGRTGIYGQINVDADVIELTNNANITGVHDSAQDSVNNYAGIAGMYIEAGDQGLDSFTAKITNNGQITLTGDEMTLGLAADALLTSDSFIKNAGTIDLQASNEDFVRMYGIAGGYMGNGAKLENTSTGVVNLKSNASTPAAELYGMYGAMTGDTTIQNDGKISIEAIGIFDGSASIAGITAEMGDPDGTDAGSQSVVNNGDITIKSVEFTEPAPIGAVGIQVLIEPESQVSGATITNNGNINVTGHGNLAGIYVLNDTDNATITNGVNGKIYVNSEMEEPEEVVAIYSENGSIHNDGIVEATIGGTLNSATGKIENGVLDGSVYSIVALGLDATVTNSATGQLNGSMYVDGALNNEGTIRLPHNGDAAVHTFTNTGTLEIGVLTDGTMENTSYSQLETTSATFGQNAVINVNVLSTSTDEELLDGEILTGVVSGETITVDASTTVTDNSTKLDFQYLLSEDGTSLDLMVMEESNGSYVERATLGGANNGTSSAASAAEAKGIDFVGIVDGDDVGFVKAVASTTPVTTMAANTANTQIMNSIQGIVETRQSNVMSGMNSGDFTMSNKNSWAKVYGSKGTQDNKDGINGFKVDGYGIGFGADGELSSNQRIGAAFFYTQAKVDVNDMNQNTDLDVYTGMVYGNLSLSPKTNFLYQAGYTMQQTSSDRVDYFNDNYKADFTSKIASIDLKLMQSYKMDNAITLRPLVEATYRNFKNPSYTESGTGTTGALSVDKFESDQFIGSIGALGEYKISVDSKMVADLRLGYDFSHDSAKVTSSYEGGYSFTTDGIDNGGFQYSLGFGYEKSNILGGEMNFMYNYAAQGSSYDNHTLSAKYVYKF